MLNAVDKQADRLPDSKTDGSKTERLPDLKTDRLLDSKPGSLPDLKADYEIQRQADSLTGKCQTQRQTDTWMVTCGWGDLNNFQLRSCGLVQDTNLDVCCV